MKKLFLISLFVLFNSCTQGVYKIDYELVGGIVIGKENCMTDDKLNYWLINFSLNPNTKQYGDTLTINGTTYDNVVKTIGLSEKLKIPGFKVLLGFYLDSTRNLNTTCNATSSMSNYYLRSIKLVSQAETR